MVSSSIVTDASFIEYLQSLKNRHPQIRLGQNMFNNLCDFRPGLGRHIRGKLGVGRLDPFYNDCNIPTFLEYVVLNWNNYETIIDAVKHSQEKTKLNNIHINDTVE